MGNIKIKSFIPLIVTLLLFGLIFFIGTRITEDQVREIVISAGVFGPVLIIFFIWLTNIIAPLGAGPFLFAGYYLYGQNVVLLTLVSTTIAAISNFLISRIFGRRLVVKIAGDEALQEIDKLAGRYGYRSLLVLRIFLHQYHDVISYAFGLTNLKFLPYFLISFFGMIPGGIFMYYLSGKFDNPLSFTIISIVVAYASLLIFISVKKLKKKFGG